jgi:hypothetical protein
VTLVRHVVIILLLTIPYYPKLWDYVRTILALPLGVGLSIKLRKVKDMNECEKYACNAATVGNVIVSTMSVIEAMAHLSDMRDSNRGESWTAAVLGKHVRHAETIL